MHQINTVPLTVMSMGGSISSPKWVYRLLDGYRSIMKQIYSPNNFYWRVRNFLIELRAPNITIPLDFQRFLAFFHSSFLLGILGMERFQYWHLLLWTLIRKPALLPFRTDPHHGQRLLSIHQASDSRRSAEPIGSGFTRDYAIGRKRWALKRSPGENDGVYCRKNPGSNIS